MEVTNFVMFNFFNKDQKLNLSYLKKGNSIISVCKVRNYIINDVFFGLLEGKGLHIK
jgi:hypothetical protein